MSLLNGFSVSAAGFLGSYVVRSFTAPSKEQIEIENGKQFLKDHPDALAEYLPNDRMSDLQQQSIRGNPVNPTRYKGTLELFFFKCRESCSFDPFNTAFWPKGSLTMESGYTFDKSPDFSFITPYANYEQWYDGASGARVSFASPSIKPKFE